MKADIYIYIYIYNCKDSCSLNELKDEIVKYWFNPVNLLINGFCNAYRNVKPKVFVEEFLGEEINDYKIFCFGGRSELLYVSQKMAVDGKPMLSECDSWHSFFDFDLHMIDACIGDYPTNPDAPKPYHLEEMRRAAELLSADFPFMRVDFYDTPEQFYVGELTFYPSGGLIPYKPESFNQYMGSLFDITKR